MILLWIFSRWLLKEKLDFVGEQKAAPTPEHLQLNQPAGAGCVRRLQASIWEWFTDSVWHKRLDCCSKHMQEHDRTISASNLSDLKSSDQTGFLKHSSGTWGWSSSTGEWNRMFIAVSVSVAPRWTGCILFPHTSPVLNLLSTESWLGLSLQRCVRVAAVCVWDIIFVAEWNN